MDILDLHQPMSSTIGQFPDAMVSYLLLLDASGTNRAVESTGWLASGNFIGLDVDDNVVLARPKPGFSHFTG